MPTAVGENKFSEVFMKSKIFTVAGLIMTAIFMMYFILAVNFTNALFPDKNSSYIALGVYVAAAALSFVIAGVLRIAEAARDGERLSRSDTFAAAGLALAAVFVPFSLRAPTVFARYSTVAVSVYGALTAIVFVIAVILKASEQKRFGGASKRSDWHAMIPALLGAVMEIAALILFVMSLPGSPTESIVSIRITDVQFKLYLTVMSAAFLAAAVIKLVNTAKKRKYNA